jgi:hypothetical protein
MPTPEGSPPPTARTRLGRLVATAPRWVVVAICLVLAGSAAGAIGLAVHARGPQDAANGRAVSPSASGEVTPPPTSTGSASATAVPAPAPAPAAAPSPAATPRPNPCPGDPPYTGPIFVTSTPSATDNGSNGHLPASRLSRLPAWANDTMGTPQYLLKNAAAALIRLDDAFVARFGVSLDIDLTYRSYADQVAIRAALGTIAAKPGTSRHGTGVALDLQEWSCIYGFGTEKRDWLVANGPTFGWVSPTWAREGASNPEYWHYEYGG